MGKADDDVWAHLPGVAAHVRGSIVALEALGRRRPSHGRMMARHPHQGRPPLIYWGMMETYHWDFNVSTPIGFKHKYGTYGTGCTDKIMYGDRVVGPFHFAKGALAPSGHAVPV